MIHISGHSKLAEVYSAIESNFYELVGQSTRSSNTDEYLEQEFKDLYNDVEGQLGEIKIIAFNYRDTQKVDLEHLEEILCTAKELNDRFVKLKHTMCHNR
jgi:archaellum component FlaC